MKKILLILSCLVMVAAQADQRDRRNCRDRKCRDEHDRSRRGRGHGDYDRGRGGYYNGGRYGDGPAPRYITETFYSSPDYHCLDRMRPVDNADEIVSDSFFTAGFRGQLAACESDRRNSSYRYSGNCTKSVINTRDTYSCARDIESLVLRGTITATHRAFFREACSDYRYTCTRQVYY